MSRKVDAETIEESEIMDTNPPEPALLEMNVDAYGDLFNDAEYADMEIKHIRGIHGIPYQFTSSADTKISDIDESIQFPYGRTYTDKIINKMPILLMSPCTPVYLDGYTKKTKESIIKKAADMAKGDSSELDSLLDGADGRYYTCKFDYKEYYDYVNGMCRSSAIYLGIADRRFHNKTYGRYNWSRYVNEGLKGYWSGSEYVCFYVDSESQISDTFSNSTGPSMLDGMADKLSGMSKEIGFMLNAGAGVKFDALQQDGMDATYEQISSIVGSYSPGNIIERLKTSASVVMAGGGLIFPEIWQDSSYSKSYDISIKLRSPDGDTESVYRNIIVPMMHALAFVMPRESGVNGFSPPFLVKAFYKGMMNIDMGIVTDMTITKGEDASWNIDGLPTAVEINMTIKDLYQIVTMSKGSEVMKFMNNTPYLDFLATTCGVVLNKPDVLRKVQMYGILGLNKVTDIPRNVQQRFNQAISNTLMKALGR